jgi:hypothetical protein
MSGAVDDNIHIVFTCIVPTAFPLDCAPVLDPAGAAIEPPALSSRSQCSAWASRLHTKSFHRGLDATECRQLRLNIFETAEIGLAGILN